MLKKIVFLLALVAACAYLDTLHARGGGGGRGGGGERTWSGHGGDRGWGVGHDYGPGGGFIGGGDEYYNDPIDDFYDNAEINMSADNIIQSDDDTDSDDE